MTRPTDRHPATRDAGTYEIRLAGQLDARWAAWFDGLAVTPQADGTTVVSGSLPDQAALHGVLQRARDLGIALVAVRRIETDAPTSTTTKETT
jgi:hypothetical protein